MLFLDVVTLLGSSSVIVQHLLRRRQVFDWSIQLIYKKPTSSMRSHHFNRWKTKVNISIYSTFVVYIQALSRLRYVFITVVWFLYSLFIFALSLQNNLSRAFIASIIPYKKEYIYSQNICCNVILICFSLKCTHIRFIISYKSVRIIKRDDHAWLACKRRQEYAEHIMSIYF